MTPDMFPEATLPQMLRDNARRHPNQVAIRQKEFGIWKPCTWRDYFERARHVGLGFRALGLGAGGHVAILSENRIEWVLAQLGANIVDGIAVGAGGAIKTATVWIAAHGHNFFDSEGKVHPNVLGHKR